MKIISFIVFIIIVTIIILITPPPHCPANRAEPQQDGHLFVPPADQSGLPGMPAVPAASRPLAVQVSVNFLEMRLPAQGNTCEAWITLKESEGHLAGLTGGARNTDNNHSLLPLYSLCTELH